MLPKKYRHKNLKKQPIIFIWDLQTYVPNAFVSINYKSNTITIRHAGNIGNTINTVKENFDGRFGKRSFQYLEKNCNKMIEEGSPEHLYIRHMQF
jgi:hypothetical protein